MTTDGKTSLVTGANSGIGAVTARALAERGDRVILACRSRQKTQPVIDEIVAATGNADVEFLELDLADLEQVRRAAAELHDRTDRIDVLVANAGLAGQRGQTAQGFELQFGVNHLGHFAFITAVQDLLEAAAPSRLVVVASLSHKGAKHGIDWDAVQQPTKSVAGYREYEVSKLANVLFAQEFARRVPADRIWACSLHPGTVATNVWRRVPWPVSAIMKWRMTPVEEGAKTSIMCATSDEVLEHHGGYFSTGKLSHAGRNATPELAAELWRRSEAWVAG